MNKRIIGLDILRVFCILFIVGFRHIPSYANLGFSLENDITNLITNIVLGTFVFISGYFIAQKAEIKNRMDLINFYKLKLFRIYPLYLITLIIFYILNLNNLEISLKAAFLISMFFKPAPLTLWFITMIMFFYLISPLLIYFNSRYSKKHFLILNIIIFISVFIYGLATRNLDYRLLLYFPVFSLSLYLSKKMKISNQGLNSYHLLIPLLLISSLPLFLNTNYSTNLILSIPVVTISSLLLFKTFYSFKLENIHLRDTVIKLSYASFCVYLFHRPIYYLMTELYTNQNTFLQLLYLIFICLPLITVISYLIQNSYDRIVKRIS